MPSLPASLGITAGVGVPAATYFSTFPPPLFREIALVTAALAVAVAFWAGGPKSEVERKRLSMWCVIASLVLIVTYMLLLHGTTVVIAGASDHPRFQVGFGLTNGSLTETGRQVKEALHISTPEELLYKTSGQSFDERIKTNYRTWSVLTAGGTLIVLYLAAFILWTWGFTLINPAKSEARP